MQTLRQILEEIQSYSDGQEMSREPHNLYDPIAYILQLGGKRLRPALVLMGYNLYGDDTKKALPAAFAIELFHNFTLMHDDIMDNAPLRRGKPTVHVRYDRNTAILSGDAMLILAYRYLMSVDADARVCTEAINIFNRCALEVCEGQQMDMDFENRSFTRRCIGNRRHHWRCEAGRRKASVRIWPKTGHFFSAAGRYSGQFRRSGDIRKESRRRHFSEQKDLSLPAFS